MDLENYRRRSTGRFFEVPVDRLVDGRSTDSAHSPRALARLGPRLNFVLSVRSLFVVQCLLFIIKLMLKFSKIII